MNYIEFHYHELKKVRVMQNYINHSSDIPDNYYTNYNIGNMNSNLKNSLSISLNGVSTDALINKIKIKVTPWPDNWNEKNSKPIYTVLINPTIAIKHAEERKKDLLEQLQTVREWYNEFKDYLIRAKNFKNNIDNWTLEQEKYVKGAIKNKIIGRDFSEKARDILIDSIILWIDNNKDTEKNKKGEKLYN